MVLAIYACGQECSTTNLFQKGLFIFRTTKWHLQSVFIYSWLVEETGYENWQTSKLKTTVLSVMLEAP